jgi:hypothetical protein
VEVFGCLPDTSEFVGGLFTKEGFPNVGTLLEKGSPYYRYLLDVIRFGKLHARRNILCSFYYCITFLF